MNFAACFRDTDKYVHRHLLPLMCASYGLAAVYPSPGLWAKRCVVASMSGAVLTVPMALLAVLLFNASIGASVREFATVVRRPVAVLAGAVVNLLTPLAFLFLLRLGLLSWHDREEAYCLLLGLTVVAAMPVAGSSAAWSYSAGGNVALSLGLVLVSTFLSPVTTPLVLAGASSLAPGDAPAISEHGVGDFLLAVVVVPSALGLLFRWLTGDGVTSRVKPTLKLVNIMVLLVLCYCNATVALPQVVAQPDWDYLALVSVSAVGLCITAFASGWVLARALGVSESDGRSLMFGLGMNNNGTGLVLAASTLGSLPWAVIPVLVYNLVQHVVAGAVASWIGANQQ